MTRASPGPRGRPLSLCSKHLTWVRKNGPSNQSVSKQPRAGADTCRRTGPCRVDRKEQRPTRRAQHAVRSPGPQLWARSEHQPRRRRPAPGAQRGSGVPVPSPVQPAAPSPPPPQRGLRADTASHAAAARENLLTKPRETRTSCGTWTQKVSLAWGHVGINNPQPPSLSAAGSGPPSSAPPVATCSFTSCGCSSNPATAKRIRKATEGETEAKGESRATYPVSLASKVVVNGIVA